MIFSFRVKTILAFLLVCIFGVLASFVIVDSIKADADSILNYTIVLDAGHGGIDGGCEGIRTGVVESELNLKITKKLESLLKSFGFRVVLTRNNADGLYSQLAKNKKLDDMKKRKALIEKINPDMVVSIHMNSFPNQHERGAQVYYQKDSVDGQLLATAIQNEMIKFLERARPFPNFSDLYILKCVNKPSVVVECGFLSNPEEEQLLIQESYQDLIAYSIFCGIVKYYEYVCSM